LVDASTSLTDEPNEQIAPFDLAVPGSLPVFQKATLIPALRAALALDCNVQKVSRFDRKHYFYHDQPAGYQITQYYQPFARDGRITITTDDCPGLAAGEELSVGIKQIQLEQDTAKTQEQDEQTSLIDYNRSGHPLIEIISLPHIHSPEVAAAYVRKIQAILLSVDAVTTGMEFGGLRADVNVSVRKRDAAPGVHSYSGVQGLGQRTEIKNLSTLKGVEDAIKAERDRQIDILEAGGSVEGETRGWSVTLPGQTRRLRGKEGEVDYRYMPDPDISPLRISDEVVNYIRRMLPILPDRLLLHLTDPTTYGLSKTDAQIFLSIDNGERLEYYQDVVESVMTLQKSDSLKPKSPNESSPKMSQVTSNWVLHELGSLLSTSSVPWSENRVTVNHMAHIVHETVSGRLTGKTAKQVLRTIFEGDRRPVLRIIEQDGLAFRPLPDTEYEDLAKSVIEQNPVVVEEIKIREKQGKFMFLVGQIMRQGEDGRVEAKKAQHFLRQALDKV
jgi:aspartyl-tRNA(Asn)/glutamyl-tRNA(Gln) amidotransferase subunit B